MVEGVHRDDKQQYCCSQTDTCGVLNKLATEWRFERITKRLTRMEKEQIIIECLNSVEVKDDTRKAVMLNSD